MRSQGHIATRLLEHLRQNVIAYLALFFALGGGAAYAAATIGSNDIERNAVLSKHLKDGQVKGDDLNEKSVAESYGAGILNGTHTLPALNANEQGGSSVIVMPSSPSTDLAVTDLSVFTAPLSREITISLKADEFTLSCTVPANGTSCSSEEVLAFPQGSELAAGLGYSDGPEDTTSRTIRYSYRIIPG